MKIEVLFPETCNLFGDLFNIRYLQQCLPEAEVINTSMNDQPRFLSEDISLVYLGPMTERTQEKIIEKFIPYKALIQNQIESGKVFLATGNALEIFGEYIETDSAVKIPALGIFNVFAKRDMLHRHNSVFLGDYEGIKITGFKTQFTTCYPTDEKTFSNGFIRVEKGMGLNKKCRFEGIHEKNFFGTYLVGPLLVLNPGFTKKLLALLGASEKLAFEKELFEAYEKRLGDFYDKC